MKVSEYLQKTGQHIGQLNNSISRNKQFSAKNKLYNWIPLTRLIELTGWWYYDNIISTIKRLKNGDNRIWIVENNKKYIVALEMFLKD